MEIEVGFDFFSLSTLCGLPPKKPQQKPKQKKPPGNGRGSGGLEGHIPSLTTKQIRNKGYVASATKHTCRNHHVHSS